MTPTRFEELVRKLETMARERPGSYALRAGAVASLGYLYLGVVTGALALLVVGALIVPFLMPRANGAAIAFIIKFGLVILVVLGVVLRALFLRVPKTEGREITRNEAPALFDMLDELRQRVNAPKIHRVIVVPAINAGIQEWPRLGLLGWFRRELVLGLPLMQALTVEQFRSVMAHELGHLSPRHHRLAHWMRRQRMRWSQMAAAFEHDPSRGHWMVTPFLRRYAPWFAAHVFPLERLAEYHADSISALLVSPRAAAEALTVTAVVDRYADEIFWPEIGKLATNSPIPVGAPSRDFPRRLASGLDRRTAERWIEELMRLKSTHLVVHPVLRDRLAALGERPRMVLPAPGQSAAHLALGAAESVLAEEFDAQWREQVAEDWRAQHQASDERRQRLAQLEEQVESGAALSPDEAFERAMLNEAIHDDKEATIALLRPLVRERPDHAPLLFALGTRLLERDDDQGRVLVERAITLDPEAMLVGAEALRNHHYRRGDTEAALIWQERLEERFKKVQQRDQMALQLTKHDRFEAHGVDPALIPILAEELRRAGARRAWLVRRTPRNEDDPGATVLAFVCTRFSTLRRKRLIQRVMTAITEEVTLPEGTVVFNFDQDQTGILRRIKRIRGSRVL
ncbi:MAG: M48 family metallopeptidase [Phycisphaeraceae bacterium]|nr:M48 family metallopeptidase [Phycisphaeraceae bacterium]